MLNLTSQPGVEIGKAGLNLSFDSLPKPEPILDPIEDPRLELPRVILFPALQQTFQKIICYLGLLYASL